MECFAVYADEIKNRIDPLYYSQDVFKIIKKSSYKIRTIGEVSSLIKTGFAAGYKQQAINERGIIQIRPTNIAENDQLIFDKNIYVNPKFLDTRKEDLLTKEEILFNNTNSQDLVGKTAFFNLDGKFFCSNHITRIKANKRVLLPKYLWIVLNLYQKKKVFFSICTNWNNQSGVNSSLLNSVKIPVPEIDIQGKIVQLMENAYSQKQRKEAESNRLLDSINDYVLGKLGIKLPELKDKMVHIVNSDEIEGRIDPLYYKPEFIELKNQLRSVNSVLFGSLIDIITKGETPLWRGDPYEKEGIPFLKVQNISINGIKGKLTYISEYVHKRMKRSQLNGGELLYTMAGSIGIATILPEDFGRANINQAISKIVVKEKVNKNYLIAILNSSICLKQTQRMLTTSAQPNINFEQIKSIKIPLPPLIVQNKIAEEVKNRMRRAEQLQKEAKENLEGAKKEVEKIILG